MRQVIEGNAGSRTAAALFVEITQQFAFLAGEQVVAPTLVVVAPVVGLVHQLLGGAGDLAVFHQAHFHFIDATGQWSGVQAVQAAADRLGVDQQAVAVNLHRCLAAGGDIDRVDRRFGVVDHQAVGTAVHHADRGVRAGTEGAQLAGQAFGVGGEVTQAQEVALQLALGIERIHRVVEVVVIGTAEARELHVQGLAPQAQAAAGVDAEAPAQVLAFAAAEVQLVAYDQAGAATGGQEIVALRLLITLGVFGQQRHRGVFQVVVHGHEPIRAVAGAGTQGHTLFQVIGPLVALFVLDHAAVVVGKVEQGHAVITGQDYHRLGDKLLIQLNPDRQRHVEKVFFKVRRQSLGLGQQTTRGCTVGGTCRQRARTKQQGERCRDGSHREHERNTLNSDVKTGRPIDRQTLPADRYRYPTISRGLLSQRAWRYGVTRGSWSNTMV